MVRFPVGTGGTWAAAITATVVGWGAALPAGGLAAEDRPPTVGQPAPPFELPDQAGGRRTLAEFTRQGPVVLLVLRGFPGYQCPICNRQVGQYLADAGKFRQAGATVVMIYPGSAGGLKARAQEFLTGKTLPPNFHLLIDPDYTFTTAWKLRWDAPQETAYPF